MEINGIAHVMLTVSDFDACRPFYARLLAFLGLKPVLDTDGMLYCVGGRTAVGIFRARERADVDALHALLVEMGATIVHPPEEGPWAPGYYSVLFEDPDGIRLEMNHVPGKGLLGP